MRRALLIVLILCPVFIYSQEYEDLNKNQYYVGLNYCMLTSSDTRAFHFENVYHRSISKNFGVDIAFGFVHSTDESGILVNVPPDYAETNIITGDWIFTSEDGIKILDLRTEQQTYIHTDILFNYRVYSVNKLRFELAAGGSAAYINRTYITRMETGTFQGTISGMHNMSLMYPYYSRLIDLGICAKAGIMYELSDQLSIGIVTGLNHYFKSGYRFYDLGIRGGIRF